MVRRRGAYVDLRTVETDDLEVLYDMAVGSPAALRWRYRGATPSPREFAERIWQGVLAQFIVCDKTDTEVIALVSAFNYNSEGGTVDVAVMAHWDWIGRGVAVEGLLLLIDELLACWDLRAIYARVPGFNYDQFATLEGRLFHLRGSLPDHDFYQGRHWPEHVISATRPDWESFRASPGVRSLVARWS